MSWLGAWANVPYEDCFVAAGSKYEVDHRLLKAIGLVESGLRPHAHNVNVDKSEDLGLMQINSGWLPQLKPFGITRDTLLRDACTNIHVGAWVLAHNIQRLGSTWNAVGAYNAASRHKRQGYVDKVWRQYTRVIALETRRNSPSEPGDSVPPPARLRII